LKGRVLKAFSGRYLVQLDGETRLCFVRGKLRRGERPPLTGDVVEVEGDRIAQVLPPNTELRRPPVANVDQAWLIFSLAPPVVEPLALDRTIAHVARAGLQACLVANKADLVPAEALERWLEPYRSAGFPAVTTSAHSGQGVADLVRLLGTKTAVLVGPSGVGKSSLARRLTGRFLQVGELSPGSQRGRHTTRWCELLPAGEGFLVDTPGFQELSPEGWEEEEVALGWPEFSGYACRFHDCLHLAEPGCAVRLAVESGRVDQGRYSRYAAIVEEVRQWRSSHPRY
jgi:ribosome biogenesis GTPase